MPRSRTLGGSTRLRNHRSVVRKQSCGIGQWSRRSNVGGRRPDIPRVSRDSRAPGYSACRAKPRRA
eukprot:11185388-Alexandrium_andersonii.AAC.1